jgi:murein DD-endopeptidase MepM/ murein hydrolase activator NlpD
VAKASLLIVGKEGVEEMKKKTEDQTKKKGMQLVATFGAVTLIALGALAVGLMNPKKGKTPNPIDLNATPTPGVVGQVDVAKQDTPKPVTPAPTAVPKADEEKKPEPTKPLVQTVDETQVADSDVPEDTAVLSPDGVIKGLNFSAETGMLWPVTGETLISFSPDHAIYHKTLDSYRTSNYVYLGSEQGTHVAAAADGVVTSVKEDVKTGTTVTMRVSENHEIIYGLLSDVTVKEGDYVDAGTVFATVAEPTRYYLEEGSGVYIQVLDQGEAINPMLYLQ